MKTTIIAATAAALLASVTFGLAAPSYRGDGPRPTPAQMAENAGAMSDARIAALKAGLRMTPDQEKLWPGVETALQELSKERIDRRTERFEQKTAAKADKTPRNPIASSASSMLPTSSAISTWFTRSSISAARSSLRST